MLTARNSMSVAGSSFSSPKHRPRPLLLLAMVLSLVVLPAGSAPAATPAGSVAALQAQLEEGMREYSEAKLENVRRTLSAWPPEAYTSGAWLVRGEAEERLAELALLHDLKEAERLAFAAEGSLKRSIALSDSAQARAALAHVYQILAHTGRVSAARFGPRIPAEIRRAIALDPSNFNARLMEVQGYLDAPPVFGGDLAKGIDLLRGLAQEFPDSDRVLYDLARALAKSGDKKAALSYAEAALRANPQNPFAARLVSSLGHP